MDYAKVYSNFISDRLNHPPYGYSEIHHILPSSLGGEDKESNYVRLSVRDHCMAHKLLFKIFGGTQINSVMCFYGDNNPMRLPFRNKYKLARWIRRVHIRQKHRSQNKARLRKKLSISKTY